MSRRTRIEVPGHHQQHKLVETWAHGELPQTAEQSHAGARREPRRITEQAGRFVVAGLGVSSVGDLLAMAEGADGVGRVVSVYDFVPVSLIATNVPHLGWRY